VREGIPLFGRTGGVSELGVADAGDSSVEYQDIYTRQPAAPTPRHWRARLRHGQRRRQEEDILRSLLVAQGRSAVVLDLPCGGMARLSGAIGAFAGLLIESDISFEQVRADRACFPPTLMGAWMTASAFHIPLRSGAVDGAVCARLAHHLPTDAELDRALAELLRVARRFVIFSFADRRAPKRAWRRLRGKPDSICYTSASTIAELAGRHGAHYERDLVWSPFGSRHTWALLVKGRGSR
jgi:SAM-dependent methyltransferase